MKFLWVISLILLPIIINCNPTNDETTTQCLPCDIETGNPEDVPELSQFKVVVRKEEYVEKITKTWFVWKISKPKTEVKTDVTTCTYRHCANNCSVVKFQYTKHTEKKNAFILKMWGYDTAMLLYLQESVCYASEKYEIFTTEVTNIMKAEKTSTTAVGVEDRNGIEKLFKAKYAILGSDWEKYVVFQQSAETGECTTFIGVREEIYTKQDYSEICEDVSTILKNNNIDENDLMELKGQFDVDTNKINQGQGHENDKESNTPSSCGVCGGEVTKPTDIPELAEFNVVVRTDDYFAKIQNTKWNLYKIKNAKSEINIDAPMCSYRRCNKECSSVSLLFQATKDNQLTVQNWGYNKKTLLETEETWSYASEKYLAFSTSVNNVIKAEKSSLTATVVEKKEEVIKNYESKFALIGSDYKDYMVFTVGKGSECDTIIVLSEEAYKRSDKSSIHTSITEILQLNKIEESDFLEFSEEIDVDYTKINTKISDSPPSDSSQSSCPCGGEIGIPDDVSEFAKYNVVVRKSEYCEKIQHTWFVWKISKPKKQVNTDITTCSYRYCDEKCGVVKFNITPKDEKSFLFKGWGYDKMQLLFTQETVIHASEKYEIFQSTVDNVMKCEKSSITAVAVEKTEEIKQFYKAKFAILGSDWNNFIVFQSVMESETMTFIGVRESIYTKQDYSSISVTVSEILAFNKINESELMELNFQFDVDTNQINKGSEPCDVCKT